MIAFREWVSVNIRRRLLHGAVLLIGILVLVEVLSVIYLKQQRINQFHIFTDIIASAIRDRDQSQMQKAALLVLKGLDGKWVALNSKNKNLIWIYPDSIKPDIRWSNQILASSIYTVDGELQLLISVPIFPYKTLFISLIICSITFVATLSWSIMGVIRRLSRELNVEISKLLSDKDEIFIDELNVARREVVRLRVLDKMKAEDEKRRSETEAMEQMASHVAHDMRSPLSVVKAYVESANANSNIEYKAAAQRSVEKLLGMARDLLDYAKANRVESDLRSIKKYIDENVISEIGTVACEKGVCIKCDSIVDKNARLDWNKIGRVLINLVNNSIEAINHERGLIVLSAIDIDNELKITVQDNGIGIPVSDIREIYNRFFSKGKKHGTGLGLSYCKQVVEAHGGTIDVESEVGKGTTFTIRIPNCVVSETEARAYCNEPQLKIEGRKFVLIDDNADVRIRWRRIVEEGGGTVIGEADSPEKACGDGLDVSAADIAIVDYNFEGSEKTGLDVIAHLKTRGLEEIHMCTGFAHDEAIRQAALAVGADSVIQKG